MRFASRRIASPKRGCAAAMKHGLAIVGHNRSALSDISFREQVRPQSPAAWTCALDAFGSVVLLGHAFSAFHCVGREYDCGSSVQN
jgi:hypothetical protein